MRREYSGASVWVNFPRRLWLYLADSAWFGGFGGARGQATGDMLIGCPDGSVAVRSLSERTCHRHIPVDSVQVATWPFRSLSEQTEQRQVLLRAFVTVLG